MPKRWSTKTPIVREAPTPEKTGVATFDFTDDYSVFHYSKMPDPIPGKGAALCRMASLTLQKVAAAGIPTHFLGFTAPNLMDVRLVRVLDPAVQALTPDDVNRLVPLQVICRNMLPTGSSVFRRLAQQTLTLADVGLDEIPRAGQRLPQPVIELTTKLEEIDRFVTADEAQHIAGLSDAQLAEIRRLTLAINEIVTRHAESVGLVHADSKIEFGIDDQGRIMLVDTAGTPDENRFIRNGYHITKQVLRDYYLVRGLEHDVETWVAKGRPRSTWPKPERLPPALIALVSDMYKAVSDHWTGERAFDVAPLDEVLRRASALPDGCSKALSATPAVAAHQGGPWA